MLFQASLIVLEIKLVYFWVFNSRVSLIHFQIFSFSAETKKEEKDSQIRSKAVEKPQSKAKKAFRSARSRSERFARYLSWENVSFLGGINCRSVVKRVQWIAYPSLGKLISARPSQSVFRCKEWQILLVWQIQIALAWKRSFRWIAFNVVGIFSAVLISKLCVAESFSRLSKPQVKLFWNLVKMAEWPPTYVTR